MAQMAKKALVKKGNLSKGPFTTLKSPSLRKSMSIRYLWLFSEISEPFN
jgi:hypothetical protein